jgi:uncharacterized membrane protein YqiK
MLQRIKRKPGGQPNNRNAVKTGEFTAAAKRARLEAQKAFQEAGAKAHAAWLASLAPIEEACRLQQAEIMEQLLRLRAEKAKDDPELWGPICGL